MVILKKVDISLLVITAFSMLVCFCSSGSSQSESSDKDTGSETETLVGTTAETDETITEDKNSTDPSTDATVEWKDLEWKWEEIPEGEDCGESCRQLVFGNEIREGDWDVWGDRVAIGELFGTGVKVIDLKQNKTARAPNPYPGMTDRDLNSEISYGWPTLNADYLILTLGYGPSSREDYYHIQFFKVGLENGKTERILDLLH